MDTVADILDDRRVTANTITAVDHSESHYTTYPHDIECGHADGFIGITATNTAGSIDGF